MRFAAATATTSDRQQRPASILGWRGRKTQRAWTQPSFSRRSDSNLFPATLTIQVVGTNLHRQRRQKAQDAPSAPSEGPEIAECAKVLLGGRDVAGAMELAPFPMLRDMVRRRRRSSGPLGLCAFTDRQRNRGNRARPRSFCRGFSRPTLLRRRHGPGFLKQ